MIRVSKPTNPALTASITEFINVGRQVQAITFATLSMQESIDDINYVVKNILEDYLYDLKQRCLKCYLTDEDINTYRFRPRKLSYDIYGTTQLDYVILALNDLYDIKQFNLDKGYLMMLTVEDMSKCITEIYKIEKPYITAYNSEHLQTNSQSS